MGRQGHQNFEHGIDILTTADYFTLGVRSNAFLQISPFVAKFPKFTHPLMSHLYEVKLFHWDIEMRLLSAKTLATLAPLDLNHMAEFALPSLIPYTISTDLVRRHGAVSGVGELLVALVQGGITLSEELTESILNIVPSIEKARLYRGRGGEIVRQAVCRLIECVAIAALPLPG